MSVGAGGGGAVPARGFFCGRVPPGRRLGLWRTRVVVQSCSGSSSAAIDPSQLLNPSISPRHAAARALTSSSSFCQRRSLSLSLSADSFPLPYVMESHLHISLTHTCSLSHASAQPTLPLLLSTAVPIALIPPLLTFSTSPPYHTEPTLKPSFLTSLRHHAAPRPPSEFRM